MNRPTPGPDILVYAILSLGLPAFLVGVLALCYFTICILPLSERARDIVIGRILRFYDYVGWTQPGRDGSRSPRGGQRTVKPLSHHKADYIWQKPKTRASLPDATIARNFFVLTDDPVVKWVDQMIFLVHNQSPGTITPPPTENRLHSEHSNYPVSDALSRFDGFGDPISDTGSGVELALDLEHSDCFRADNPETMCPPGLPRLGCPQSW